MVNRVRPDMVRRGDMMDIDDIIEILAIELLGVVPDDEQIIVRDEPRGTRRVPRPDRGGSGVSEHRAAVGG